MEHFLLALGVFCGTYILSAGDLRQKDNEITRKGKEIDFLRRELLDRDEELRDLRRVLDRLVADGQRQREQEAERPQREWGGEESDGEQSEGEQSGREGSRDSEDSVTVTTESTQPLEGETEEERLTALYERMRGRQAELEKQKAHLEKELSMCQQMIGFVLLAGGSVLMLSSIIIWVVTIKQSPLIGLVW